MTTAIATIRGPFTFRLLLPRCGRVMTRRLSVTCASAIAAPRCRAASADVERAPGGAAEFGAAESRRAGCLPWRPRCRTSASRSGRCAPTARMRRSSGSRKKNRVTTDRTPNSTHCSHSGPPIPSMREEADQQGADAEEQDEEPAGSGQLQEPEDEPEHRPMPPLHVHDALHQCPTGAIMDGITRPHKAPSAGGVRRARVAALAAGLGAAARFRPVQRRAVCGCAASRRAGPATSRAPGRCRRGRRRAGPVRRCAAPPGPSPCAAPGRT